MATAKQEPTPAADPLATKVAVILRSKTNPGLKRCGNYELDRVHSVPVAEAQRLVDVKGFEFNTPGDGVTCREALAAATKAAEAAAKAAALAEERAAAQAAAIAKQQEG